MGLNSLYQAFDTLVGSLRSLRQTVIIYINMLQKVTNSVTFCNMFN